jgi:hypothetical protein
MTTLPQHGEPLVTMHFTEKFTRRYLRTLPATT